MQLVHNYSAIASADVYVDGAVVASAVAFQTASAFIGVDASVNHTVQIVAAGAAAPTDALTTLTLTQGEMVSVVITDRTDDGRSRGQSSRGASCWHWYGRLWRRRRIA